MGPKRLGARRSLEFAKEPGVDANFVGEEVISIRPDQTTCIYDRVLYMTWCDGLVEVSLLPINI